MLNCTFLFLFTYNNAVKSVCMSGPENLKILFEKSLLFLLLFPLITVDIVEFYFFITC